MREAGHPTPNANLARALARILREGSANAVLASIVSTPRGQLFIGAKILIEKVSARAGTTGDAALDEEIAQQATAFLVSRAEARMLSVEDFAPALAEWHETRVLFERVEPEPRVVVCGAGHVGAALARLARQVGYRVTLIDDRAEFVARELFPDEGIELVAAANWTEPVRASIGAGRGVAVAVVTRGHNEDDECLRAALAARPDYVGMIGSRRRTNIVLERLRADGFAEEVLRAVCAPVGLDIGAVTPEEVALSILAEVVAHRRGGKGGALSAWRREEK